jgi:hypothetical protein
MPVTALCVRDGLRIGRVLTGVILMTGLLGTLACGDDDDKKGGGDASTDAAVDAGGNFIPKRDASVAPTDPIIDCDRFGPNTCPTGTVCDVVVRLFAGEDALTIYTGCVEPTRERGLGDPCDPDFTAGTPYQAEGLTDLVFRDQCGQNLICAADPNVRGGTSCQPACATGQFDDNPSLCEDTKSFCVGAGAFREYCRPSEGCDVTSQTGCPSGLGCYLRPSDDGGGFLSVCFPPAAMTIADGSPCQAYNACRPGSSCNGPLTKALSTWEQADYVCRASCLANGTIAGDEGDAGTDDGGAGTGSGSACAAPKKCNAFAATGLDLSSIETPPYGQCD